MPIFLGGMKPLFWGDTTTIVENKPLSCAVMTPFPTNQAANWQAKGNQLLALG